MDIKDYQSGYRKNHFWFRAKNNLINALLLRANLSPQSKILNIGGGTGNDLKIINDFGDVYMIDNSEETIGLVNTKYCREKKLADARQIPYANRFFDTVVIFDVLEHIEEDRQVINEIIRVLKPNGKLIFTVPAFGFLFSNHDKALGHYRRYNKREIKKLLERLSIQEIGFWNFILSPLVFSRFIRAKKYQTSKLDFQTLPSLIDQLFFQVINLETWLIKKGVKFPFGVSLYGIYVKK